MTNCDLFKFEKINFPILDELLMNCYFFVDVYSYDSNGAANEERTTRTPSEPQ